MSFFKLLRIYFTLGTLVLFILSYHLFLFNSASNQNINNMVRFSVNQKGNPLIFKYFVYNQERLSFEKVTAWKLIDDCKPVTFFEEKKEKNSINNFFIKSSLLNRLVLVRVFALMDLKNLFIDLSIPKHNFSIPSFNKSKVEPIETVQLLL